MATKINTQILEDGAHEDRGIMAKMQYFVGGIAVGDMIKSTLGPFGADKILLPMGTEAARMAKATITNDGATILSKIWIDNPSAQLLVNLAQTQDTTVGDGTTGVVVLAAELLREAEHLCIRRIHPQVIAAGYQRAMEVALRILEERAVTCTDRTKDELLRKLARTTLSSKIVRSEGDHFVDIAVEAVKRLDGDINLDLITIVKVPGALMNQSYVSDGFLLKKELPSTAPDQILNAKIMLADTPMDSDKVKIFGARVKTDSFEQLGALAAVESEKMTKKVELICKHEPDVFINRQLIYDLPMELFVQNGVLPIEHADFGGIEALQKILDCDITAVYTGSDEIKMGFCEKITRVTIGETQMIHFQGTACNNATTIVLRGSNEHSLDEAERSLHDALAVLSQTAADARFVYGGGAIEMAIAAAVEKESRMVQGKVAIAMMSFAKAFRSIPNILLDNAGHDSTDVMSWLESGHYKGDFNLGVDLEQGKVADMSYLGIVESLWSKRHQVINAVETAVMLVRCDEVIRCAPRERRGV